MSYIIAGQIIQNIFHVLKLETIRSVEKANKMEKKTIHIKLRCDNKKLKETTVEPR